MVVANRVRMIDYVWYLYHYCDAIMGIVASQITSLTIVYTTVYSDADQSKHQSCASLAFVWGIHRGPVNSPHKGPVTRKMFPFDDVIMCGCNKPPLNLDLGWIITSHIFMRLQFIQCCWLQYSLLIKVAPVAMCYVSCHKEIFLSIFLIFLQVHDDNIILLIGSMTSKEIWKRYQ